MKLLLHKLKDISLLFYISILYFLSLIVSFFYVAIMTYKKQWDIFMKNKDREDSGYNPVFKSKAKDIVIPNNILIGPWQSISDEQKAALLPVEGMLRPGMLGESNIDYFDGKEWKPLVIKNESS
jgi:hypothetical protein